MIDIRKIIKAMWSLFTGRDKAQTTRSQEILEINNGPEMLTVAANILEECARETMSASDGLRKWPVHTKSSLPELDQGLHSLIHFQSDADIRARDEEYAEYQRENLMSLAAELKRLATPPAPDER